MFPGAIDVHAHFSEPERTDWEGFLIGSQMMEAGGVTTYFDMPLADDYLATRPVMVEVEAVERALHYAKLTGCALHFVQISSTEAVTIIEAAKASGQDVTLETCPHYLLFMYGYLREQG